MAQYRDRVCAAYHLVDVLPDSDDSNREPQSGDSRGCHGDYFRTWRPLPRGICQEYRGRESQEGSDWKRIPPWEAVALCRFPFRHSHGRGHYEFRGAYFALARFPELTLTSRSDYHCCFRCPLGFLLELRAPL